MAVSSAPNGPGYLDIEPWRKQAHDALGSPVEDLAADLTLVDEGIRLRRRHFDADGSAVERDFLDQLLKLQQRITIHLAERAGKIPPEEIPALADRLDRSLGTDRSHLDRVLAKGTPSGVLALQLERLRGDLMWRDQLLHACIGRTPPHPSFQARAALDVAMQMAVAPVATEFATPRDEVEKEALGARRRLLETRAASELTFAQEPADLPDAWRQRFVMSRLQADVDEGPSPGARETAHELARQRDAVVDAAFERLAELEPDERFNRWERVQEIASASLVESAASADTVKPRHALRLLELNVEDAVRLREQLAAERGRTPEDRLRRLERAVRRGEGGARNRLQSRQLHERQKALFGPRLFRWWEALLLVLVLLIVLLLFIESILLRTKVATHESHPRLYEFFALADLTICTVFLFDFGLRLALVQDRLRYFRRHFIVDFLAAIPFGFIAWWANSGAAGRAENLEIIRLLRLFRLQALQPLLRILRLFLFAARFADGLVNRYAKVFNRNIVLWELAPTRNADQRTADKLSFLRDLTLRRFNVVVGALGDEERLKLARALLVDLDARIDRLPSGEFPEHEALQTGDGVLLVEDVITELVTITPERLNEQMGPPFSESVARFVRMFDLPLIRSLPGLRDLTALRSRGAAEIAAAAVNKVGRLIQRLVEAGHYFADLRGTVSAPILVDRVGVAIVAATAGPAKRLIVLLVMFLAVYGVALLMPLPQFVDDVLQRVFRPLTGFVAAVGALCIIPLGIGVWLKRVARQASEFGERLVEAQFIGQTKNLKRRRTAEDSRLLFERTIGPELALRAVDDADEGTVEPRVSLLDIGDRWTGRKFHEGELAFLRVVELMYGEFLDGSPFHRSDAKTATQLLGNLAVLNLRQANARQFKAERRKWEALDLNRSPGLFGGPFLWFSYINRLLSQETATLMLDYNLNAQPLERLPMLPKAGRDAYRRWLADRKRVRLEEVAEIDAYSPLADVDRNGVAEKRRREPLLDNVQFTALDVLIDDPARDAQIKLQYGEEVAELVKRDRRELIRKAFRTFPLHDLPRERRTINPLQVYQRYAADGRLLLLPFRLAWWLLKSGGRLGPAAYRSVRQLLRPTVTASDGPPCDSYAVAVRKIHRMRKPMFLTALWLRANFDVEYLGLRLPGVPGEPETVSVMERDLDFIEASHFDRLNAERLRARRTMQLDSFNRVLGELRFDYDGLAGRLKADFPPLVERRGEVVRALVAAGMADYDDVRSLAAAVAGLRALMAYAADARNDLEILPPAITRHAQDVSPQPRRIWSPRRDVRRLFNLPCFPGYELWQQKRIRFAIGVHKRIVRPWVDVLVAEGGRDPLATLEHRLLDIIRRVDLWSDQLVSLRTLQTMTILDVDHYCRFVWELGRYADFGEVDAPQTPTGAAVQRPSRNGTPEPPDPKVVDPHLALEH
jgi:hypothetical protein